MTEHSKKDAFTAQLALHASRGTLPATGDAPSAEDMALLLEDKLDFTRKQQVYSHINADGALFKQWLDLVEAQQLVDSMKQSQSEEPSVSIFEQVKHWFTPMRAGLIGAGFAGFMAVMIIPQYKDNVTLETAISTPRMASTASTSIEEGILYGLVSAANGLSADERSALALQLPEQAAASSHTQAIGLGYELLYAAQACQQQSDYQVDELLNTQLQSLLPTLLESENFCGELTRYIKELATD